MKNTLILAQIIVVLFFLTASTSRVQAEAVGVSNVPTLTDTINALLAEVAVLQKALNSLMAAEAATAKTAAPSANTKSQSVTFVPDGSTFGTASTITSILVSPSNGGSATLVMVSDKNEVVISTVQKYDDDDDGSYLTGSDEKVYQTSVSYEYNRSLSNSTPEVTYSPLMSEQELLAMFTEILDYDALLADNAERFLIENPVYYRGRSGGSYTGAYNCYEPEDEKMMIDVVRFILDADSLKYRDLDEIVIFSAPKQFSDSYSYYGRCYGTFNNTLEN